MKANLKKCLPLAAPWLVLLFIFSPVKLRANPTWIKCQEDPNQGPKGGPYIFSLDEKKERYSTKVGGNLIQGKAVFFPDQISFTVLWHDDGYGGGIRDQWSIDRRTLYYAKTTSSRIAVFQKEWGDKRERTGKCAIIKAQDANNKI